MAGLYKIHDLKIKVPENIALIGFDGAEAFDFFYSPLTYVKQPVDEMGKEAVRILLDQISGSKKISHVQSSLTINYKRTHVRIFLFTCLND